MSRVDDASEERRAEAREAERRAQERLQRERKEQATAFDRALAAKASPKPPGPPARGGDSSSSFRRALSRADAVDAPTTEGQALPEDSSTASAPEGANSQLVERSRASALGAGAEPPSARGCAPAKVPKRLDATARRADSETRRGEVLEEGKARSALAGVSQRQGEPVESDARGGGGSEKDKQGGQSGERMAAFKLPPAALMAPPPLALPKGEAGAALRGATREIVEKIVRRVLVGTNEQGAPEFRLDLKSDVLQGLSIRVSASRGKRIRAVFSGSDRAVLASLERTSQELKDALAARGLVLEELIFEESSAR